MNTRVDQAGNVLKEGAQVLIDGGEAAPIRYIGLCYQHWLHGKSGINGNV